MVKREIFNFFSYYHERARGNVIQYNLPTNVLKNKGTIERELLIYNIIKKVI